MSEPRKLSKAERLKASAAPATKGPRGPKIQEVESVDPRLRGKANPNEVTRSDQKPRGRVKSGVELEMERLGRG